MEKIDLSWKRYLLPQIHPEGWRYVAVTTLIAMLASILWLPSLIIGVPLVLAVYLFFRDPPRVVPLDDHLIVSPADGTVCRIDQVALPEELDAGDAMVWRVCVFMSVLNVHVNRVPVSGNIEKMVYIAGKFFNASLDKASEHNERQLYLLRTDGGKLIACVQIAGLIARRIVSFVKQEDKLICGQRFGLIRFGSRVDVYLPEGIVPVVRAGQTMIAGETVIARLAEVSSNNGDVHE